MKRLFSLTAGLLAIAMLSAPAMAATVDLSLDPLAFETVSKDCGFAEIGSAIEVHTADLVCAIDVKPVRVSSADRSCAVLVEPERDTSTMPVASYPAAPICPPIRASPPG